MAVAIHNCHTHLFNVTHVPPKYYPIVRALLGPKITRKPILWMLKNIWLLSDRDIGDRLARFVEIGNARARQIFEDSLVTHYSDGAKFVVLPMDMSCMEYGVPPGKIVDQHEDLAELALEYAGRIFPFVHFDPRRPNALACIQYWIEERHFKGVKIYPPLGYRPTDACLSELFAYCVDNDVPVMTHCSEAPVRAKRYANDKVAATMLADPKGYLPILERHPNLRLCFGHFGGVAAWAAYRRDPQGVGEYKDEPTRTWLNDIRTMLANPAYAHLYADVSYTMFRDKENVAVLKVLLQEQATRDRTLFGSDFYMSELERTTEREHHREIRNTLGEALFSQVAQDNVMTYLGHRAALQVIDRTSVSRPAPVPQACGGGC